MSEINDKAWANLRKTGQDLQLFIQQISKMDSKDAGELLVVLNSVTRLGENSFSTRDYIALNKALIARADSHDIDRALITKAYFSRTEKSIPVIKMLVEKASVSAIDEAASVFQDVTMDFHTQPYHLAPLLPRMSKPVVSKLFEHTAKRNYLDWFLTILPHTSMDDRIAFLCNATLGKDNAEFLCDFLASKGIKDKEIISGILMIVAHDNKSPYVTAVLNEIYKTSGTTALLGKQKLLGATLPVLERQ